METIPVVAPLVLMKVAKVGFEAVKIEIVLLSVVPLLDRGALAAVVLTVALVCQYTFTS